MSLILLLFLTLACLPIDWPAPRFGLDARWNVAATGCMAAGLLLLAAGLSRWTIRQVRSRPGETEAIGRAHGLRRLGFFFVNLLGFALMLLGGWGWTARELLTFRGQFVPGGELLILLPYFTTLIGSWFLFYDAERALHRSAAGEAAMGYWSRWGYVSFLLRQHVLLVFSPLALMIVQLGVLRTWPELLLTPWAKLAGIAALICFIVILPSFVPLLLGLKRMPAGPIRSRLEAAARRLGVRYRELHVWDTRGNLATAMVTGLLPRFRHIVFTDLLLRTLREDEIEAVFGHEVGHVKHGHLFYYAAFLLLSFLTLGAAYRALELGLGYSLPSGDLAIILTVCTTGLYLFLVFGFIARRCERQADVFGSKAVSCADPDCQGHQADTPLVPGGRGLCRTGVGTFVRALERVEVVNGMARTSPDGSDRGPLAWLAGLFRGVGIWLATWQHSTIARRVAFLNTLPEEPGLEQRFQFQVFALRWGLLLLLLSGVVAVAVLTGWQNLLNEV